MKLHLNHLLGMISTIIFMSLYERETECREKCHLPACSHTCVIAAYYSLQTSWNQCGTREHRMHNVLKQMSRYWHLSLLILFRGKTFHHTCALPPYDCDCDKYPAERWHLINNKPARKAGLHRAPWALNFWGPHRGTWIPGPSLDTKDCSLLEQGFLGFIIRQMCRHGNPSQALNLFLCRGMLSLLTAVFPPTTFLPKLGELDVPFRAAEGNGEAWDGSGERKGSCPFLSELLGDVFKVLVPNLKWSCKHHLDARCKRCAALSLCSLVWGESQCLAELH